MERIPGAGDLSKNLPCMKVGRAWRLRREALEEFMRQSGRPETLTGRMSNFLEVGARPRAGAAPGFVRFGA